MKTEDPGPDQRRPPKAPAKLMEVMRGFAPLPADDPGYARTFGRPYQKVSVDNRRLPLPDIVHVVFIYLGSVNLGRGEKLAWEHTFQVDGVACSIASEKFGMRLYIDEQAIPEQSEAEALAERIINAVVAGQKVVEREVLRPLSVEQMKQGNITIRNQYHSLRFAYDYFREGAQLAYSGQGRLGKTSPRDGFWLMPERTEAWLNTFAMITSYFSLLEHVLVGCLPFSHFDPAKETVTGFIGSKWGDKFRRILDPNSDSEAMKRFMALSSLAETYRNTYGHGGFDKAGATVGFHIPGIGAIPAVLSDIRTTPHFDFLPTAESDFDTICKTFDEFDEWLSTGRMANAWSWITGGLDYRFDATFREATEMEDFSSFMDEMAYRSDQAANMDW